MSKIGPECFPNHEMEIALGLAASIAGLVATLLITAWLIMEGVF